MSTKTFISKTCRTISALYILTLHCRHLEFIQRPGQLGNSNCGFRRVCHDINDTFNISLPYIQIASVRINLDSAYTNGIMFYSNVNSIRVRSPIHRFFWCHHFGIGQNRCAIDIENLTSIGRCASAT